jgi:hypothetical protein
MVEKRLEHAVSGLEGAQKNGIPTIEATNQIGNAQSGGLDVGALLGGIAQGQESSTGESEKATAGNIANQIAGGGSTGLDQIISGLNGQKQSGAKNQSITQEQGQAKEKGETNGKDQVSAQKGGGEGLAVQVEKTTILEANGQQIKTEIIKEVGTQSTVGVPAEERQTPAPAPMLEMAPEAKPSKSPAEGLKATVYITFILAQLLC